MVEQRHLIQLRFLGGCERASLVPLEQLLRASDRRWRWPERENLLRMGPPGQKTDHLLRQDGYSDPISERRDQPWRSALLRHLETYKKLTAARSTGAKTAATSPTRSV